MVEGGRIQVVVRLAMEQAVFHHLSMLLMHKGVVSVAEAVVVALPTAL